MKGQPQPPSPLVLESISGPWQVRVPLEGAQAMSIGRRPNCHVPLTGCEQVSREHAVLSRDGDCWFVRDSESRHGTWLNGVRIEPDRPYPISHGDLLEIPPFVFRISDPAAPADASSRSTVQTVDAEGESGSTIVTIAPEDRAAASHQRLELLLEMAEAIHAANTQEALAEAVVTAAMTGTAFTHAAFLGPMDDGGRIPVLARRAPGSSDPGAGSAPSIGADHPDSASGPEMMVTAAGSEVEPPAGDETAGLFSRSLIEQASGGKPASLSRRGGVDNFSKSIVTLGIDEALCVPVMVGSAVAGYLYMDRRRSDATEAGVVDESTEYAIGLGRVAALAIANLKRSELEQRFVRMEAELAAAAEAQSLVLPPREGRFGELQYIGESRPGRVVSGDFFDVFALAEDRIVLTLGDVCGKGVSASVLMTAAQGFLRAAFARESDPAAVVCELAAYLRTRCAAHSFLTLWAAVIDGRTGRFDYVDAGHGYGLHLHGDGCIDQLREAGGIPVGVPVDWQYSSATGQLRPGDRLLVVSDGIVEQPGNHIGIGNTRAGDGSRGLDQFGLERLTALGPDLIHVNDEVASLFDAVVAHAGQDILEDDATAVAVRWRI